MVSTNQNNESFSIASLFILIPAFMLIFCYYVFPYPLSDTVKTYLQIPMFLGLILLGVGFFIKKIPYSSIFKIFGWFVFAFYWATQPTTLYISEGNDIFNGLVCVIGVFVLCYIAYHEWVSINRKERISCLNWIAGASCFAGIIYFGIERTIVGSWLTGVVAEQSTSVFNSIIGGATANGTWIYINGEYVVTIIFACTAIQAMVIFVGMIGALSKVKLWKIIVGLIITIVPIYILNLFRNAMVIYLVGHKVTNFFWAHNVISKVGALITLIILLLIVIKLIPEIFDEIICLTDLYKRKSPIELTLSKLIRREK